MIKRLPAGGLGLPEGSDAKSGPSRVPASVRRLREQGREPTTEQIKMAQKRSEGANKGLYGHWLRNIRPLVEEHGGDPLISVPIFARGTRNLRDNHGKTNDEIKVLFELFALAIARERLRVRGKPIWFVFLKSWTKLGGSATSDGLGKDRVELTRNEDWE